MSETMSLLRAARALRRAGEPALLATVVRVLGSSRRRPGARTLVSAERGRGASVRGGCLESDVLRRGWRRACEGGAVLVTYDAAAPDEVRAELGLDAGGVVEVLLEGTGHGGDASPLAFIEKCHAEQRPGVMATVFRSAALDVSPGARLSIVAGGAWSVRGLPEAVRAALAAECVRFVRAGGEAAATASVCVCGATLEVLLETVRPSPRLFVLGAGEDAVPLVDIARTVGWETVVCAPRTPFATPERFPSADAVLTSSLTDVLARIDASERALAVVMSHDYERDRDALGMLLASHARFIGVLGPEQRTAQMLDELGRGADGFGDERLHAPVGLALGAESPEEVALAIVAEMQAALTRSGAPGAGPRAPSQFAD